MQVTARNGWTLVHTTVTWFLGLTISLDMKLQYDYDYGHPNSPHQNYSSQKHTPPKSNIDTTNDGLENVWLLSNMAKPWISMWISGGVKSPKTWMIPSWFNVLWPYSHWISIISHLYLHPALKGINLGKPCLSLSHWFQWHNTYSSWVWRHFSWEVPTVTLTFHWK